MAGHRRLRDLGQRRGHRPGGAGSPGGGGPRGDPRHRWGPGEPAEQLRHQPGALRRHAAGRRPVLHLPLRPPGGRHRQRRGVPVDRGPHRQPPGHRLGRRGRGHPLPGAVRPGRWDGGLCHRARRVPGGRAQPHRGPARPALRSCVPGGPGGAGRGAVPTGRGRAPHGAPGRHRRAGWPPGAQRRPGGAALRHLRGSGADQRPRALPLQRVECRGGGPDLPGRPRGCRRPAGDGPGRVGEHPWCSGNGMAQRRPARPWRPPEGGSRRQRDRCGVGGSGHRPGPGPGSGGPRPLAFGAAGPGGGGAGGAARDRAVGPPGGGGPVGGGATRLGRRPRPRCCDPIRRRRGCWNGCPPRCAPASRRSWWRGGRRSRWPGPPTRRCGPCAATGQWTWCAGPSPGATGGRCSGCWRRWARRRAPGCGRGRRPAWT